MKTDSRKISVQIKASKNNFKRGDELQFQVLSDTSGYLTLISIQPDGSIVQLLPNKAGMSNEINAGMPFDFPGTRRVSVRTTPPFGKDTLRAFVTKNPFNLFEKNEMDEAVFSSVKSGRNNFIPKGVTVEVRTSFYFPKSDGTVRSLLDGILSPKDIPENPPTIRRDPFFPLNGRKR